MSYETITVEQVGDILALPDAAVLDMRDARSFVFGHIEGARHASDAVVNSFIRQREPERPILIYCYHGVTSRDLAKFFTSLGYRNVYSLDGGWQAWETFLMKTSAKLSDALIDWGEAQGFDTSNLNSRIDNAMTMLMQAALQGEQQFVLELLGKGCDPDLLNDDENNALWFSCVSEDPVIIQSLIDHGININHQNVNGATALIYAASAGKYNVVRLLVSAGAELAKSTLDGFNALDSAATLQVLKYLKPHYTAVAV
jgi:rhodanese-related sulfurtransferase